MVRHRGGPDLLEQEVRTSSRFGCLVRAIRIADRACATRLFLGTGRGAVDLRSPLVDGDGAGLDGRGILQSDGVSRE